MFQRHKLLLLFFFLSVSSLLCLSSSPLSIYQVHNPAEIKHLSIYIEKISPIYNGDATSNHCVGCNCTFRTSDDIEPLIHCLISKSEYVTTSKKDATFIFVPVYTNLLRKMGKEVTLESILQTDDAFKRWHGARHIVVDSIISNNSSHFGFGDQHLLITPSMPLAFIRGNRWINSRHILIPPLQTTAQAKVKKTSNVVFIGNIGVDKKGSLELANTTPYDKMAEEVCKSKFVVFKSGEEFTIPLLYDAIRCQTVPVLISQGFLPAYANTVLNYSDFSMRVAPNNLSTLWNRIDTFDRSKLSTKTVRAITWPTDLKVADDDAAAILFDFLVIRHRVLKPVLRRTYLGSDEYI